MNNAASNLMENKPRNPFNSKLANLSQGSCDNTPDTPDSLDSLVGSETDGVGGAHRDEEDEPPLSITEPEASSQSLDAHSPLSPDRGIFSSLGGAQTTDVPCDYFISNTQCKNAGKSLKECTIDPMSIVAHSPHSPKYTTSPFPSGLDENDSKSVTSSVTSLSCQQTAVLNTSTGNLSSCQISQRDNLIEEVSTPVPTSQQRYLHEGHPSYSQMSKKSPETVHRYQDVQNQIPPQFNAEDSFGHPLLSSSCSPTLNHSQPSSPTVARNSSTSPTTSVTPPLLSSQSRNEYAFENSSITTMNVEFSNLTESEKLSQTTPLGSTKSSIFSASPSSNFTSTLCAQSSSTTPICKQPNSMSLSIPSNCSSLISSQTSFKQNSLQKSTSISDHRIEQEMNNQSVQENPIGILNSNNQSMHKQVSHLYISNSPQRQEVEKSSLNKTINDDNESVKSVTHENSSSVQVVQPPKQDRGNKKYEHRRHPCGNKNNPSPAKSHTQGKKWESTNRHPITKQPMKSSDMPLCTDERLKRDANVSFEEPNYRAPTYLSQKGQVSNIEVEQHSVRHVPSNQKNHGSYQGQLFSSIDTQTAHSNIAPSPKDTPRNEVRIGRTGQLRYIPHEQEPQQQPTSYTTNQMMANTHEQVGHTVRNAGPFILHPMQAETNYPQHKRHEYYCQRQQPIYMAIIPTQGHHQMMPGNHPQFGPGPEQSPSSGSKNNFSGGVPNQSNVAASPTIISGLPFSGSPHYATLGRLAKDKVTGNMVFISCDPSGNPHQAFMQGRSPVQLRASCSNPQLQSGTNVPNIPKKQMCRSMSQDQNHTLRNASQPASPKIGHSPSTNRRQYTHTQVSPATLHKPRKDDCQDVSSRYATIGRHNHKTNFSKSSHQVSSPQMQQLQRDLQATMKKRMEVKDKIEPPPMKQSHVNKMTARKVNHNLASKNCLPNLSSKEETSNRFETRESLPLADVRKMATNVILQQPIPLSQSKPTPIIHQQPKPLDVNALQAQQPQTPTYNLARKVDSQCTDKDITTNESESESDQEDDEDDEDKVRRDASLPTILLPKPKRKPPFTIEGAMNSILKRNKKTEKEVKLDNVRFQKEEENTENNENSKDIHQHRENVSNEDKNFFSFFSNDNKNNNKNDNSENSVHNCDGKKKKSSFSFTKLRVNLNKTNNLTLNSTDTENNNPSHDNENEQIEKLDNVPSALDHLEKGQSSEKELANASPRNHVHNKFESMEQRREARLMKYDKDGKKGIGNDVLIDKIHIHGQMQELNGNVISSPLKENLLKQDRNHISNSSTTSRESLNTTMTKSNNPHETFNNRISSKFKRPWRKSKKTAPPPPPPIITKENTPQVTNPIVHTVLPNGYAVGAGNMKQNEKVEYSKHQQNMYTSSTNEILLAGLDDPNDQQSQRDDDRLDSVEPQDGKNSYEIIGTRRDVLDEELLVDLRDLDQIKANQNKIPEEREAFPTSPLGEGHRQSKQVNSQYFERRNIF